MVMSMVTSDRALRGGVVQDSFDRADGSDVPVPPAEALDQLDRGAEAGEGLHAKDAEVLCWSQSFVGVLVEQGIKPGAAGGPEPPPAETPYPRP